MKGSRVIRSLSKGDKSYKKPVPFWVIQLCRWSIFIILQWPILIKYLQKKNTGKKTREMVAISYMTKWPVKHNVEWWNYSVERRQIFTINRSQGTPAPAFSNCKNMGEFLNLIKHQFIRFTNRGRPFTLKSCPWVSSINWKLNDYCRTEELKNYSFGN